MRRIVAILIALIITLSTSGFMVFVHHCHHHQETFASVFVNFNDEAHHSCSAITSSCAKAQESCCHKVPINHDAKIESKCCSSYEYLLRISPDTEPAKKHSVNLRPKVSGVECSFSEPSLVAQDNHSDNRLRADIPRPGPAGRQLIIGLHQIKICDC